MKLIKIFSATFLLILFMSISPLKSKAQVQVSVSYQYFYDNLSPYGSWVSSPQYGNVWVPNVAPGFRPYYSHGSWVYTNNGWMWASSYNWGWAPFHYGSWYYDSNYGWMWVPGYDWAPAQVTWGYYSGYYGWAPMGPGIAYGSPYYSNMDYWVFCHPRYMTSSNWTSHTHTANNNRIVLTNDIYITQVKNITLENNNGNYNGNRFNAGPKKETFEKASNQKLQVVSIKDNALPVKASRNGNECRSR